MAVSSANNSSSASSMIDVAAVVDQLMQVENRPFDRLTSKIDQQKLVISDLGSIKSKVASFQDALTEFENPLSYSTVTASSSNNSVLTASGSSGAALGSFAIVVDQVAQSSGYSIDGFANTSASLNLNEFEMTVGGKDYSWPGGTATISSFAKWVNSLGIDVSARIIQTDSDTNYALQIYGTKTGATNAVTFEGLKYGTTTYVSSDVEIQTGIAQDSEFSVNGVDYVRPSNTITGIIDGVTLNLVEQSDGDTTKVSVTRGADNSEVVIKKLIDSYNDLMSTYKSMTANAFNSDKPGNFANNPTMLSFVSEIKSRFSQGMSYGSDLEKTKSLSWMGIDIQRDGTLKFNDLNFFDAQGSDLQAILSQGVKVGFLSTSQSAIASVTFKALQAGQSITVSGLTLTATSNASAEKVASAFANIGSSGNPNATDFGIFNGTLVGWTSESNTNGNVIFNSTTKKRVDISLVASGSSGALPTISFNGQNDLNHFIDGLIGITGFSGSLADMIKSENTQLSSLNNRQADLKDRLAIVQNSLISQYSALNALLYQLSQTNNALTSALDAISNNSKN